MDIRGILAVAFNGFHFFVCVGGIWFSSDVTRTDNEASLTRTFLIFEVQRIVDTDLS